MTFSIKPDINIVNCLAHIYTINYWGNHRNIYTRLALRKGWHISHAAKETRNKWLSRKIKPQTLSSITSNTLLWSRCLAARSRQLAENLNVKCRAGFLTRYAAYWRRVPFDILRHRSITTRKINDIYIYNKTKSRRFLMSFIGHKVTNYMCAHSIYCSFIPILSFFLYIKR